MLRLGPVQSQITIMNYTMVKWSLSPENYYIWAYMRLSETIQLSVTGSVWEYLREVDEDPSNNSNVILFYMQRSQSENDTCGDGNQCTSQTWNREHVWPKSHGDFGTSMTKVAGTDLPF